MGAFGCVLLDTRVSIGSRPRRYTPLAWWGSAGEWQNSYDEDRDIWGTLSQDSMPGELAGLVVSRGDVLAVANAKDAAVGTDHGGVVEARALMLWFFLDVSAGSVSAAQLRRVDQWESALLAVRIAATLTARFACAHFCACEQACAAVSVNASQPFEAHASLSSSVETSIAASAEKDVPLVVGTMFALCEY
eukprot:SAG11_NODE_707_length_7651_cov_4.133872_7_plen_191_part_00